MLYIIAHHMKACLVSHQYSTNWLFIPGYHLFHNKNDCFRDYPNDITMFAHNNHFEWMLISVRLWKNNSHVHLMNHPCESIISFHLLHLKMKAFVGLQMKPYSMCIISNQKKIFCGKKNLHIQWSMG